jgi:hypothetical protein
MEVDPEEIIGKYWQRIDKKFPELRLELEKLDFKPGIEAENSTDLADFLEHLDCEPLLAPLKACYPRFGVVRPRLVPRFKFAAFCKLKRFRSIREGHAYLRDHPDAYKKLGFKKLPNYELLREFLNEEWVKDRRGTPAEINKIYQKYWRDQDFKLEAELDYQLEFLYGRGDLERVGAYLRNKAMERFEADPKSYLKGYHRRNKSESTNSHLKEKLDLERGIPKGKTRAKSHVELCVLARNLVALTRLQQGVTENLTTSLT